MTFSPMIQNLISSGGEAQAKQRLASINNYVNNLNPVTPQNIDMPEQAGVQSFDKVMQSAAKSKFGMLLQNPNSMQVNANIYNGGNADMAGVASINSMNSINSMSGMNSISSKPQILNMIEKIANKHGIDDKLVKAVIRQESGFNPKAKSKCGAMGLMQLMPSTARGLGVTDAMNPVQNVEGGVKYLKSMLKKYNGNVILALAAYNAGPGAVDKYDGVPPYKETQNYVKNILANYL